jgi:hypothetical protein
VKIEKKKNSLTLGNPASGKNSEKLRPNNSSVKGDRKPTKRCQSKDHETLTSREKNDGISHIRSNHLEQRFDMKAIPSQPDEEEEECNLSPRARSINGGLKMNSLLGLAEEESISRDTVIEAQAVPPREHESQDSTDFFLWKNLKRAGYGGTKRSWKSRHYQSWVISIRDFSSGSGISCKTCISSIIKAS